MSAFVDFVKIQCVGGRGGHGCCSFRREAYIPFGGPDGGNGGHGGDVYLRVAPKMTTLLDCKMRPLYRAKNGKDGRGKNQHGAKGEHLYIDVPLGTIVTTFDETGAELETHDLTDPETELMVARGGKGGRGNQIFATPTNRAPSIREDGDDGEVRTVILELKLIADVGLVGLPNAGKSTLLSALTRATPKVAPYPFTTLHPNLGVIELDYGEKIVLADIPGLIEGASRGQGLGHRFLRHIERTRALIHLVAVDADKLEFDDMWERYTIVRNELATYSPRLIQAPEIVCVNQIDRIDAEFLPLLGDIRDAFRERGVDVLPLSAHLEDLQKQLVERVKRLRLEMDWEHTDVETPQPSYHLMVETADPDEEEEQDGW